MEKQVNTVIKNNPSTEQNTTSVNENTSIQVVLERISGLHEDVSELKESTKESMRDIASALNKLVALETNQANNTEITSRLLSQIEKLDHRLQVIEQEEGIKRLVTKWTLAAVWGAAVAACTFVAKTLGLF
jgi:cell division protein FtsX